MLFLKIGVLILPFLTIAFIIVMVVGLRRTYDTQKISLPGVIIWIAVLLVSIVIVFTLLMVSIFGILTLYFN
jgi:hypothetical protein